MFYPNEASEFINKRWRDAMGIEYQQQTFEDIQRQRYDEIQEELASKFRFFLDSAPPPSYREEPLVYGAPAQEPDLDIEALQEQPSQGVQEQEQDWYSGGFRSVGKRIWSFLSRKK